MASIEVVNPGMYTSVQDLGRRGYEKYGVPVSGSMDDYAHRLANLLVGNREDAAVLEMTILGGTLKFDTDMHIAITGADMAPIVNEVTPAGMWRVVQVKRGDVLKFGAASKGCRCYMAVSGGFAVETVLGSSATYVRGKFGGYEGRPLKAGDKLETGAGALSSEAIEGRFIPADAVPVYGQEIELRVTLGPQEDAFTREGIGTFFSSVYTVTNEFDRMGYRLEGDKVSHEDSADIISDGIVKGAIQIPGHGNPIIMLADCQTTGGYTKIAHVITTDLRKIAQAKAGDRICFKHVDIEQAQDAYCENEGLILRIGEDFEKRRLSRDRDMKLSFLGKVFSVKVNEIKDV